MNVRHSRDYCRLAVAAVDRIELMTSTTGLSGASRGSSADANGCHICLGSFSTARGLGQHKRRAHPIEANEGINVECVNRRWTDEEMRIIAEAELGAMGQRHINRIIWRIRVPQGQLMRLLALGSKLNTGTFWRNVDGSWRGRRKIGRRTLLSGPGLCWAGQLWNG